MNRTFGKNASETESHRYLSYLFNDAVSIKKIQSVYRMINKYGAAAEMRIGRNTVLVSILTEL
jgi:hypothetical protein